VLMVDADGATDINDLEKVYNWTKNVEKNGLGCAIGCRNSEETKV
jgi:hypothetical protein